MPTPPPPVLPLDPPVLGSACAFLYTSQSWEYTSAYVLFSESVQSVECGASLLPLGQLCRGKAEGIMEVGA